MRHALSSINTLGTLMVLGLISGCGGGDGSSGSTGSGGDTRAPVVSLSAPASVEGGETVAIAVTVTDNVDTALVPTLSCTGGTLTGSLLVTAPVTADTSITCTATATDKAGNSGTGRVTIAVKQTVASLTLPDSMQTMAAGQIGLLTAANLPLAEASYGGTLDGKPITIGRGAADFLTFLLPTDLAAGSHSLALSVGGHSYSYAITTTAAPTSANPQGVVRDALSAAKAQIDALIASDGAAMPSAARARYGEYSDSLGDALASLGTYSAADLSRLAALIQANGFFQPTPLRAAALTTCEKNAGIAVLSILGLGVGSIGGGFAILYGDPLTKLVGVIGVGAAIAAYDSVAGLYTTAYNSCTNEALGKILPSLGNNSRNGIRPLSYAKAVAVAGRIGFQNDVPQNFTVERTYTVEESVAAKLKDAYARLIEIRGNLPFISSPAPAPYAAERTEIVPGSQVTLGAISPSTVTGSATGAGNDVTLRFKAKEPSESNIDFDFVVNLPGAPSFSVPAQLAIALPGADDAAFEVVQGKPTQTTVQARGQDSLEIVTQPAHGTASLSDTGLLTYTPAGQYFGSDTLTYRARNTNGVSRTATVLITVVRKFDGQWNVTSRSTTTSQSQAGLCPNETNSFSITVSRISDTQYTASYQGFPITLTMGSKDDPAGLAGSTTVTYPDDPGTTTESLSAKIPDSTHLSATGSFSYSGPNNSRCNGTTSVTGTRP